MFWSSVAAARLSLAEQARADEAAVTDRAVAILSGTQGMPSGTGAPPPAPLALPELTSEGHSAWPTLVLVGVVLLVLWRD